MFIAVPRWKENNYIFTSTHNFAEIIKSAIISTDRVNCYDNDTNSELFVCKTPYLKRLLKFQRAAEKWKKLIEKEYNKLLKLDQELNASSARAKDGDLGEILSEIEGSSVFCESFETDSCFSWERDKILNHVK